MKILKEKFSEGFGIKLFYKKDYLRVLEEKKELERDFDKYKKDTTNSMNALEDKAIDLLEQNSKLKDSRLKIDVVIENLKAEIKNKQLEKDLIKDELIKAKNQIGGYKKANKEYKNKNADLKKQVKKLTKENADLKSDRYLRKPLPADKTKSTIKTKISSPMKPSVRKFMKEKYDYKEVNNE